MDWKSIGFLGTESPWLALLVFGSYSRIIGLLSELEGSRWCSRYSCTASSVMFPVLHAPYPIAQKCFHQYFFERSGNSIWSFLEVRHLSLFTIVDISRLAGYSICMCTWSLLTTHLRIRISSASQIWMMSSLHLVWISHLRTWYLYFVTQTMWAVMRVTVCHHALFW